MGIASVVWPIVIEQYIEHAEQQIDQFSRRVFESETIAHYEKVLSIFEEHTEWLSKGEAGVPQGLDLSVCVLEVRHGFILRHKLMENQKDVDLALAVLVRNMQILGAKLRRNKFQRAQCRKRHGA